MAENTPILIPESAVPRQVLTGVQYVVTAICSFLLGRGWVQADTVALVALLTPVLLIPVYGIYRAKVNNDEKKIIVNSHKTKVPVDVARVVR